MDFIGQQGPSSKLWLVGLDVLVLGLQLVALAVHVLKIRLKDGEAGQSGTSAPQRAGSARPAVQAQDLDHEERGVRRSQETADIEMQNLNPATARTTTAVTNMPEDTSASASGSQSQPDPDPEPQDQAPETDTHISNAFNSGQIVLADLNIAQTIRDQFWAYQNSSVESRTGALSSATGVERVAFAPGGQGAGAGGLGIRVRVGGRIIGF